MSPLALYLLGPPRVERDGKLIEVNRRKALALVAYLAVTGQSHSRDSLVNLLWPEYDSSRGRAALRRTLFTLRSALGGDQIEVEGDQLGLRTQSDATSGATLWTDIAQFREHLAACPTHRHADSEVCASCAKPLTDAVSLVDGDFMSGFSLKDSFNFDDWQRFEAERLHRELDGALERLVRWHSSQREFEPAVGYARHRLAIDPLNEGAHRQLMRLHAWAGRRSAALRQYQECMAILKDQLDLPPQATTTALYEVIQEGRAPPLPDGPREGQSPILCETLPGPPAFLKDDIPIEIPLFVARQRELARLDRYLQSAFDGQGKVVLITGEAGAGKTALIQEFSRRAQDSHPDLVIAVGHCNAHTGVGDPYLPFREILGLLTGDVESQWAAGAMTREQASRLCDTLPLVAQAIVETGPDLLHTFVLPSALLRRARSFVPHSEDWLVNLETRVAQRPYTGPGTSSLQQGDLFDQYTRVMQALEQHHPVLLVVDDLQWADLGSISLLFHLGRQLAGSRLLVLGSYRPEEVAMGRSDPRMASSRRYRHPLEGVVHELQRLFGDITVNLGDAEAQEFVDLLLDSEPNQLDTTFRQALHARTQGHPLFTVELLRGLQERGDLVRDSMGRWVTGSSLNWERLPARVEAVIAERISRLAQPLRAALRVASVEGEVFTAEVIAQVRGLEEQGLLRLLSRDLDRRHRLIQAQSIQRAAGQLVSRYRFRHILFQRYIYGSLDEVERVHLHQRVGTALEGLYGTQDESVAVTDLATIAPQLARHFQEARNTEKALHYLHQAGQRAAQLSAYEEAIAQLNRGLALLSSMPASPEHVEWEKTLQISLGVASKWTLPDPVGESALNRARELCLQTGDTTQLVRVLGELAIFPYVRAEHQRARELTEDALKLAKQVDDPLLKAVAEWHLGFVLFVLGEFPAAHNHLQKVIAFYNPEEHHAPFVSMRGSDAGVSALAYDAVSLWCLGFPAQADQTAREALTLARQLDHEFSLADVLCFCGCVYNVLRREPRALKYAADELIVLSRGMGFTSFSGTGICYSGEAMAKLGQVQEGLAKLRQGIITRQRWGARCYQTGILASLGEVQAADGQPEEALDSFADALALIEETGERYYEAELHRLKGELLLARRDEGTAEASFHDAIEVARRQSARSWELRATISLVRLWQNQGRADEAHRQLAGIYEWFTEGFDTHDLKEAQALLDELAQGDEGPH